jgi:hypothetical protein
MKVVGVFVRFSMAAIMGTIKSGWCLATILSNASPSSMFDYFMGDLHGRSIFVTVNRITVCRCVTAITNSFLIA